MTKPCGKQSLLFDLLSCSEILGHIGPHRFTHVWTDESDQVAAKVIETSQRRLDQLVTP